MPKQKNEDKLERIALTLMEAVSKKAGVEKARMLATDVAVAVTAAYELGLEDGHDC
jgi:hypothetical protein